MLFPPTSLSGHTPSSLGHASNVSLTLKVGEAVSLTSTTSGGGGEFKKPVVLPSSAGFPPRSLHAFIPGVGQVSTASSRAATTSTHRVCRQNTLTSHTSHTPHITQSGVSVSRLSTSSPHMTRVRVKADQERVEKERLQALTKVLNNSLL